MHINKHITDTRSRFYERPESKGGYIVTRIFLFLAGFVISAICELERNAIQLALGSFYPTLLLSGTYKIKAFVQER